MPDALRLIDGQATLLTLTFEEEAAGSLEALGRELG